MDSRIEVNGEIQVCFCRRALPHSHSAPTHPADSYFARNPRALSLLPGYEVVYHREGLTPSHRHGDEPPEQHDIADLVARKPEGR